MRATAASVLALGLLAACGPSPNRPVARTARSTWSAGSDTAVAPGREGTPTDAYASEAASPPGTARRDVAAYVAGAPIYASDLLEAWLFRASPEVRATLEELVLSRLVMTEAARLGVELEPERVERAQGEVVERLEERVAESGGDDLQEFVRRRLGLDPDRYLDRLARETSVDLLAARVVRAWMLGNERAEVRVIVVDRRDDLDVVQAKLARGEDFAALAARYSIEDSGTDGGRIPPVVRGRSTLARLAFSTPVGEVGGPVFEDGRWLLLRVEARPRPLEGDWDAIGPEVEASLEERAIEDPEYWQWKADVLERYEVDLTPLLELVGEIAAE